jgi:pimeloyl-ACP methyl ester carboxylesterase
MAYPTLESLFFTNEGLRLHAVNAGPSDGPALILLHGFPEFWWGWHHQIAPLTEAGYRVIVPDQRGYNLSDKPPECRAYRLDRLGGDVLALMDQLGIQQAFLAGHDFGAAVTWWLLLFHPHRFRSAAILNVPHPRVFWRKLRTSPRQLAKSWYMFAFQVPRLPEWQLSGHAFQPLVQSLLGSSQPGTFSPDDLEAYRSAWAVPGSLRAMIHWYRASLRYGFPAPRPTDGMVSLPVLILWGEEDRFLSREMAMESLAFCRQGRCLLFPGVSHWIQHEEPARVAGELIAHFAPQLTGG